MAGYYVDPVTRIIHNFQTLTTFRGSVFISGLSRLSGLLGLSEWTNLAL